MQETLEIIQVLKDYNIRLKIEGEQVRLLNIPADFPNEILHQIKLKKSELISFYKENAQGNKTSIIPKTSEQENYPLSGSQKRLWLLSQLDGGSIAYNTPFCYKLKGILNLEALKRAILELTIRHESLRTIFIELEGDPRQRILSELKEDDIFKVIDLTNQGTNSEGIEDILIKESERAFNLATGPLLRVTLIRLSNTESILFFNLHHIISDGWSMDVILKDLLILYDGYTKGVVNPLAPLSVQYKDYSAWQAEQNKEDKLKSQKAYWKSKFEGEVPVLNFPTDRPRPKIQSYKGDKITFEINEELTEQIKTFCKQEDVTLFMTLLAFVKTLLYRYTNQNDIVVGVPVAGREHAGLEDQVGFYVNTLALRTSFEENVSFQDLLSNVKEVTLGAYEHQGYGFDQLIEELNIPRDLSRNPLFDAMVVLQNTDKQADKLPTLNNLELERYVSGHVVSKFDITFNFVEQAGKIRCDIEYSTDLFDRNRFDRLSGHLLNFINRVTLSPSVGVNEINILTNQEQEEILTQFNNTQVDYPKDKTVIDLWEASVKNNANNIALVEEEYSLSYLEFYNKVLSLAGALKEQNIGSKDIVAIIADRSIEMMVTIYAIMKAGAAYLPIDPEYPGDRISYILKDSQTKLVISNTGYPQLPGEPNLPIIDLKTFNYQKNPKPITTTNQPSDLAYVIYTSGSTGNPKGVMVEHGSLSNLIQCMQNRYPLGKQDAYLFKTTYTFDVSVSEIFGWFFEGGKIVVLRKGAEKEPESILKTIKEKKVTHVNFVPSMFSVFLDGFGTKLKEAESIKYFFIAGEALSANLVKNFKDLQTGIKLENIYGPTEATVYSCGYSAENWKKGHPVYIGKPLDNIRLYITNTHNQLQPKGVPGELIIAGECVARGYLNNRELSETKFIPDPFVKSNKKAYKSGDLVQYAENGEIEYFGRIDNQVKVRGFRIELGEIEKSLEKVADIREVVVNVVGDTENKQLVAYYTSQGEIEKAIIKATISKKLPGYMVPDTYVHLDELPKTTSGKIDRKRLPIPGFESTREYIAPRNETERKLADIWSEVLGIEKEKISIDGNFFELGGHSLKALKIINKIFLHLNYKFSIQDLFLYLTIIEQAKIINSNNTGSTSSIERIESTNTCELSPSQKRFYLFSQLEEGNPVYNMVTTFNIKGKLNRGIFKKTINIIIERHEILRTIFISEDDEPKQKILQFDKTKQVICWNDKDAIGFNIDSEILKEKSYKFNLQSSPPIRLNIFQISDDDSFLILNMHHIIGDGYSTIILINEILTIYNALINNDNYLLDPLKIQYKDFVVFQKKYLKKYLQDGTIDKLKPYLSKDFVENSIVEETNYVYDCKFITKKFKCNFNKMPKVNGLTPFIYYFAIYNILLGKLFGSNKLSTLIPVSGRQHPDTINLIGIFINLLPVKTVVDYKITFAEYLEKLVKEVTFLYEFQDIPFDVVMQKLGLKSTFFNNVFSFQDVELNNVEGKIFDAKGNLSDVYKLPSPNNKIPYEYIFTLVRQDEEIQVNFEFASNNKFDDFLSDFLEYYFNVAEQVSSNHDILLNNINIENKIELSDSVDFSCDFNF